MNKNDIKIQALNEVLIANKLDIKNILSKQYLRCLKSSKYLCLSPKLFNCL